MSTLKCMRKCEKESKAGCRVPKNPANSAADNAVIARNANPAVIFKRAPVIIEVVSAECRLTIRSICLSAKMRPGQDGDLPRRGVAAALLERRFRKAPELA
ncbi:hypothetical protein MesoLj113b_49670 [Mesorhizobium sp. 113-3-3]|nr:hypothetical protein MesoLj113b_49670 [Mesorhizobium sp. 113-3-3]